MIVCMRAGSTPIQGTPGAPARCVSGSTGHRFDPTKSIDDGHPFSRSFSLTSSSIITRESSAGTQLGTLSRSRTFWSLLLSHHTEQPACSRECCLVECVHHMIGAAIETFQRRSPGSELRFPKNREQATCAGRFIRRISDRGWEEPTHPPVESCCRPG